MKKNLLLAAVALGSIAFGQVRTNSTVNQEVLSNSTAFMDASSSPDWNSSINLGKGLIFPRVDLVQLTALSSVGSGGPANYPTRMDGMLVYNVGTGRSGLGGVDVVPGFYYYENKSNLLNGGTWKPLGSATTLAGANGKSVLNGTIEPLSTTGTVGDFYINTATNQIYGPKTASGWGVGTSLIGPQGIQGPQGVAGPAGATGPQGLQGPAGPVGATGAQGFSMLSGTGVPASSLGVNGDSYVDAATGTVYKKTSGVWTSTGQTLKGATGAQGIQGPQGVAGPAGATGPQGLQGPTGPVGATGTQGFSMLSGTGVPASSLGVNGDSYVDAATGTVYKKTSGVWTSTGQTLKGATGAQGIQGPAGPQGLKGDTGAVGATGAQGYSMLSGTGVPASSLGIDGDSYVDATTGTVYKKSSGSWTSTGQTLKGATGAQGIQGPAGPQGLKGDKGDTGAVGATGPRGLTGPAGATGAQGYSMLSGTGVPASSLGVNGDSYVDAATGTVYKKASGAWTSTGQTLKGATGAQGIQGPAGPQGLKGDKGDTGAVGATGPRGLTGPQGVAGPVGPQGPKGDKGDTGAVGATGPRGLTGPQGPAGVITATNGLIYTANTQTVSLPTATTGQVLKWNGSAWAPGTDNNTNTTYTAGTGLSLSGTTFSHAAHTGDVTGTTSLTIANNAVNSAKIADGSVSTVDLASGAVTADKLNQMNATNGQVLKWNGTAWAPGTDNNTNTTYSGSTSITLSGTSFQRAALTGDVTAAANNNATTVARIQGRNVANTAPANGQVLKWNGTAWAPAADNNTNTTYSAGVGLTLSGTTFSHSAHTGDVTGTTALTIANNAVTNAKIANNAVNSAKIADGTIVAADIANATITADKLNQMNAANGQVLKWNGTAWAPAADNNTNTTYSGSTSITLSGTSFQRAALTGDVTAAANNNVTTVARIQGRNVANTAPANGQVLKWNGTAWAPAADNNTNTTYSGSTSITLSGTSFQ
ncbi:hypothetical protein PG330_03305, partial [Riemerella anatipestifer]|nr:hypothetical protein [Riemerella anatipestifer]